MKKERIIKTEKGMALVLVLILLLVGALIITPLLSYMVTGLKAGETHEELLLRNYAADAGVEDAIWKIMNDQAPNATYSLIVNGKDVSVDIILVEDVRGFLEDLLGIKNLKVSPSGHGEWAIVTHSVKAGTHIISISYNGSAETKFIDGIGAWLQGDYSCTDNSPGDDDITDTFPKYTFTLNPDYKGGTAFIWRWKGGSRPVFQPGDNKTQSFTFTPSVEPKFYISWVDTGSTDIGVVTSGEDFGIYRIIAKAIDNGTGKYTQVTAYVSSFIGNATILTWDISQN